MLGTAEDRTQLLNLLSRLGDARFEALVRAIVAGIPKVPA